MLTFKQRLLRNGPMAVVCALAVFWLLNLSAWINLRGQRNVCPRQGITRDSLQILRFDIAEYQSEQGHLPKSLGDLPDSHGPWSVDAEAPADQWGRPLEYRVLDEQHYELKSLGRDGRPGGVGLDGDLYHDGRDADSTLATFSQYFLEGKTGEVDRGNFVWAGLLAAAMVGYITWFAAYDPVAPKPMTWRQQLIYGSLIVAAAVAVGTVLLPLHIPTGH